jgi:hypothetical protein
MVNIITGILSGAAVYLGLGALFGLAFITRGVQRVDAAAEASSIWFRLLILPGSIALWPFLLLRWVRGASASAEHNAHRAAALDVVEDEA